MILILMIALRHTVILLVTVFSVLNTVTWGLHLDVTRMVHILVHIGCNEDGKMHHRDGASVHAYGINFYTLYTPYNKHKL